MSTNVQILKVTSVYSLLAETHSLHVHYGCAVFTMTSRISSKAEHCCNLNHCGGMQHLFVDGVLDKAAYWQMAAGTVRYASNDSLSALSRMAESGQVRMQREAKHDLDAFVKSFWAI